MAQANAAATANLNLNMVASANVPVLQLYYSKGNSDTGSRLDSVSCSSLYSKSYHILAGLDSESS